MAERISRFLGQLGEGFDEYREWALLVAAGLDPSLELLESIGKGENPFREKRRG